MSQLFSRSVLGRVSPNAAQPQPKTVSDTEPTRALRQRLVGRAVQPERRIRPWIAQAGGNPSARPESTDGGDGEREISGIGENPNDEYHHFSHFEEGQLDSDAGPDPRRRGQHSTYLDRGFPNRVGDQAPGELDGL
jgi:hypothetical protein